MRAESCARRTCAKTRGERDARVVTAALVGLRCGRPGNLRCGAGAAVSLIQPQERRVGELCMHELGVIERG